MAGNTLNRGYPYPTGTDANDVPFRMQALAEAVDADVDVIGDNLAVFTSANVGCRMNMSGSFAAGGANPTAVPWTTDKMSPNAGFANNGTTVTVPAGQYQISVMAAIPALPGSARVFLDLAVNGAVVTGGRIPFGGEDNTSGTWNVVLPATGTIGVRFYQNTATNPITMNGNVLILKRPAPLGF